MRHWPSSRWVLAIYLALVLVAVLLGVVRLIHSLEMPGLGAIELVLLALPWSLALGIEPMSRLGVRGMMGIVFGGVVINGLLLRVLGAWLDRHRSRRGAGSAA